ncbi:tyrosine-type recombinase/integrase [Thermodesulfovibrio sp. TK110]
MKIIFKTYIKHFLFHDLRNGYASQFVMNGLDLKTVQELPGHKSLTMTLRYAHLSQFIRKRLLNSWKNYLVTISLQFYYSQGK